MLLTVHKMFLYPIGLSQKCIVTKLNTKWFFLLLKMSMLSSHQLYNKNIPTAYSLTLCYCVTSLFFIYHHEVKNVISIGPLPSTFPVYNETANKHEGANEKQVAKHKETKDVVANLMNHHKQSGSQPFAWCTCVYVCVNRWRWVQRVSAWNKQ